MKKKDLKSLRSKTKVELKKLVGDKKKEVNEAFVKTKTGQEKNLKKVKNARRDIAQILTLIKEKEIVEKESKKGEN